VDLGTFVAAMFGPHQRKYAQLGEVGLFPYELDDEIVFLLGEVVFVQQFFIDHCIRPTLFIERNG
jgi:hypothetical protein